MKVTITNTHKIVQLETSSGTVPARVWQGETEDGIPVHCFITRIVPEIHENDPQIDVLTRGFEEELQRCEKPRVALDYIPLRFFID